MKTTINSDRNGGGMCQVTTRDGKVEYLNRIEHSTAGLYEAVLKPNLKVLESMLTVSQMEWHQRLGHASESTMKKYLSLVREIHLQDIMGLPNCEPCKLSRSTRSPRPLLAGSTKTRVPLDWVQTDLVGLFRNASLAGC